MPKKSITTKQQKPRSSKRTLRVTTCVTSKTQDLSLKRAIKRLESRKKRTLSVDLVAPKNQNIQIETKHGQESQPFIQHKEQPLSPFVLSLKKELLSPQQLIQEASLEPLHINLLTNVLTPEPACDPKTQTQEDLRIHSEEIQYQLNQDLRTHTIASAPTVSLPAFEPALPDPVYPGALRCDTHLFRPVSSEVFVAKKTPEDIFAYFDFPEEEDESSEETEMLPLEELELPADVPIKTKKRTWTIPFPSVRLPLPSFGWQRAIASFIGLSFLFVLPLHAMNVVQDLRGTKSQLEQTGEEAVSFLSAGAQAALAKNASQANVHFSRANERFQNAKNTIDELGEGTNLLLSILPMTQSSFQTGEALVEVGKELSIAGERLSAGYAAMETELQPTPVSRLNILEAYLNAAIPHLQKAQEALEDVDLEVIPQTHQSVLLSAQKNLPTLLTTIDEFRQFFTLATTLLGAEGTKRYLIAFQNNTEIRPTGGFIGSFAEIKIHDGVIEHLEVPGGGSYDLQGSLKENLVAPEPLRLLSARWEFQDGNWFPDFPTSARQLMQFYQDAGGPSVDGVLAVNATFVSELIGLLGPIEMEEYDRTITEENFIFEAQKIVEYEYDKQENTPKAFIGDLAPKLVERAIQKTSEDFLSVVDALNKGLTTKDLQIYLAEETLQRQILDQGWGGEIKWTNGDYLMIVDANLGGGKTDGVIEETVDVSVDMSESGKITNTVTINRTHYGIQGLLFTGVNNVDYLRIYTPKGSKLLKAEGFSIPDESLFDQPEDGWTIDDDLAFSLLTREIDSVSGTQITQEHGKTVFGNWVQTKPGTTSTITFTYELPFTLESLTEEKNALSSLKSWVGIAQTQPYTLTLQKQSGVLDRTTRVHVQIPETLKALWSSHTPDSAVFSNETDDLFSILLESL
ncbi:DUF4012 domain-containing protein [Candidatus Uhrbacteria bacterium]|nr:DUF4012 domain-containing protein [Candidatus Uhrbacteria bacterium]